MNILSHLFPSYYSSNESIDSFYNNDISCIQGFSENLHYSGYDYMINNTVKAHYYYTLNDNICTIYLISSDKLGNPEVPPITIDNLHYTANLQNNSQQLNSLLNYMASDLNWNYEGLSKYTQKTIINEYNYHKTFYIIIAGITIIGIIISFTFGFFIIIHIK